MGGRYEWAIFISFVLPWDFVFSVLSFLMAVSTCRIFRMGLEEATSGARRSCSSRSRRKASFGGRHASRFNLFTLAAFLAWFGRTGYLLTRYSTIWFVFGLGIALLSGATGGAIIYMFLSRVLMSEGEEMDPADYEMTGVLGRESRFQFARAERARSSIRRPGLAARVALEPRMGAPFSKGTGWWLRATRRVLRMSVYGRDGRRRQCAARREVQRASGIGLRKDRRVMNCRWWKK